MRATFSLLVILTLCVAVPCFGKFTDFKKAFDAAHVRLVASGEFGRISAVQPTNVYVQDCTATPSSYPFPTNPTGVLRSVIANKIVLVGTIGANVVAPLIDTTTNPPTGWSVEFVRRVFEIIGAQYSVQFTVQWKYFASSNAALQALYDGEYHVAMPNFGFGAFWNGTRRKETFETSCTLVSSKLALFVRSNATFTSLADLKAASGLKVVTFGSGSAATAMALFPGATVTDISTMNGTAKTAFEGVRAGTYDVSVDVNPFGEATTEALRAVESNFVTSAGGLFRREEESCPSCPTCPPSTPYPTPFPSPSPTTPSPTARPTSPPSCPGSGGCKGGASTVINVNFENLLAGMRL